MINYFKGKEVSLEVAVKHALPKFEEAEKLIELVHDILTSRGAEGDRQSMEFTAKKAKQALQLLWDARNTVESQEI